VAEGFETVSAWNVERGENLAWKVPVPGLGHSSPVIWGDRIFLTTAVSLGEKAELKVGLYGSVESQEEDHDFEWRLMCLDKKTGRLLWSRTCHKGAPRVRRHPKSSHANASPATDGSCVVAFFGSEGLFCYEADGRLRWKKDLGTLDWGWYVRPSAQWGGGSSPVIFKDTVILLCDVQKGSFLAAFGLENGDVRWKVERRDVPTWGTPTLAKVGDRWQAVVNGYRHAGGYDPSDGREIWRLCGGGDIPVPTPVAGAGLIFLTSAHGRFSPIYAVRPSAKGDISLGEGEAQNEHIAWSIRRGGNYMQTPIVYGGRLYACRDSGYLSCFEARTGKRRYRHRIGDLAEGFTASPVAADGKLYFPSEKGRVYVVRAGAEFELIARNRVGESCMASPAVSEGTLYFRTRRLLVAVGPKR
jgi:outer membrane protein assembly factor BamB